MSHVFGPVPSRRLGRSLGIDLVPFKTCSYDCIYCQLGRTTNKTIERKEYVPLGDVLEELDHRLAAGPQPDYVTLSGSGEPTLYSRLGPLISGIKGRTDRPVAVLTNGSLLWDPEVRESLLEADLVIPSLDAGDDATFQRVNRPHAGVSFERMLAGLETFRWRFAKPIWLEVLLLKGLTDTMAQLEKIGRLVERINPDRVQLNTASRPPSEDFAAALSLAELKQAALSFGGRAEIIAEHRGAHRDDRRRARREEIISLLKRRPCTLEDVADGLALHPNEVAKHLGELVRKQVLVCERDGGKVFYKFGGGGDDGRCAGADAKSRERHK
jgi:wyosine [tRNA(Phe)-imidazoG37] synthetase (radical SAM superfamily)